MVFKYYFTNTLNTKEAVPTGSSVIDINIYALSESFYEPAIVKLTTLQIVVPPPGEYIRLHCWGLLSLRRHVEKSRTPVSTPEYRLSVQCRCLEAGGKAPPPKCFKCKISLCVPVKKYTCWCADQCCRLEIGINIQLSICAETCRNCVLV